MRALVAAGTTVLLTTQYLDEADQLADTVAVVDAGRVVAAGSPERLKDDIGGDRLDLLLHHAADLDRAAAVVAATTAATPSVDATALRISVPVGDRVNALAAVLHALRHEAVDVADVAVRRPTLDEVFLRLTDTRTVTV